MKVAWLTDFHPFEYNGGAEHADATLIEYFHEGEITQDNQLSIVTPDVYGSFWRLKEEFDVVVLSNTSLFPDSVYDLENVVKYEHDFTWCKYRDSRCFAHDCKECFGGGHRMLRAVAKIIERGATFVFQGDIHRESCENAFYIHKDILKYFYMVSPINVDRFKDMKVRRKDRGVYIGSCFKHKNIEKIIGWSNKTDTPVDIYGRGSEQYENLNPGDCHRMVPNHKVPYILNGYRYFVYFPDHPSQTTRGLLEAYYSGCEIISNPEYTPPNPTYLSRKEMRKQPQIFWEGVRKHVEETNDILG